MDGKVRKTMTFTETGRTHQSFKDECDINTILGQYRKTGFTNHVNLNKPVYADFTTALDYHSAMNAIIAAGETFDSLPARVRAVCDNDPAKLIAYVEDPKNADELVKLGLAEPITPRENPEVETPPDPEETS